MAALPAVLSASAARAQFPLDLAAPVSGSSTGIQNNSDLDMAPNGGFTVVWQEGSPAFDISLRSFNSDGTSPGGSIKLNEPSTDTALEPAISDANGNWVAIWRSDQNPDAGSDVWGRLTYDLGATVQDEFQLNSIEATDAVGLDAAVVAADMTFVAVWKPASDLGLVRFRKFESQTAPLTSDTTANQTTAVSSGVPTVAAGRPDDGFVVVWAGVGKADDDIFGRCFRVEDDPLGDDFLVSEDSAGVDSSPKVVTDSRGAFTVAWINKDGGVASVVLRRFDQNCAPVGGDHLITTVPIATADSMVFDIARDGAAIVAWETTAGDADGGVAVRELGKSGQLVGGEFLVANATAGVQNEPSVAIGDRIFAVTWTEPDVSFGATDVFYRRYQRRVIFTDDFEIGDSLYWSFTTP